MDTMVFGYRLYPSYRSHNGNDGWMNMVYQLITKHDWIPALSTERRLLFFSPWLWQPYLMKAQERI
jgi:hypothetical protein